MIIRQALFEGSIQTGREDEFKAYVAEKLYPLWQKFPGVRDIKVLHNVARDEGAPNYAMILSMKFDSEDALAKALESPVRYESRDVTKGLTAMFEGRIHHHVFDVAYG
ncbi:EthD family reductase [Phyllobacterium sp. SB3]|uniref:EthD family reductase n=1 Tax=Phyllobacterium sp. SB3 TaxID=3156073 RepID=UPI0032AEFC64